MSRSKQLFRDMRVTIGNHFDKALERYYKHQNIDKEQLNHIQGKDIQKWK